jgi:hypothetical protein
MKRNRQVVFSIVVFVVMLVANQSMRATSAMSCEKYCGYGGAVEWGTRLGECGTGDCYWVECSFGGCGLENYPNYNDDCGTWIPCFPVPE